MPHPTDIYVGSRVREARAARGMSQEQLGRQLGISFQQIQKYEKGTNRIGASRLWDIGKALGVPVSYFFEGVEDGMETPDSQLPRRTIHLAKQLDSIPDEQVRAQLLNLIKAFVDGE